MKNARCSTRGSCVAIVAILEFGFIFLFRVLKLNIFEVHGTKPFKFTWKHLRHLVGFGTREKDKRIRNPLAKWQVESKLVYQRP